VALRYDGSALSLVVNPSAGGGRAGRLLPKVTGALLTGMPGVSLRVFQTSTWAEARLRCIEIVERAEAARLGGGTDSLLVMGGDGMMHLGLNAAANTGVPLGLVPAGRGNDFCRGVGVPTQPLAAVDAVVGGHTTRIDLMSATGNLVDGAEHRWVGSIVSTGFDGRVNYRSNHSKMRLGALTYGFSALAELSSFEPLSYRMVIDGVVREQTAMFIAVGNAGWFGGGMQGCPRASVTDGKLDLTVINPVSRMTLLRLLPAMYTGGFVTDPAVELLTASEVVVDGDGLYAMADGEELGAVPVTLRAVPDTLTLYTPAS
jgi:diacylglycerol kinase (ATP)